MQKLRNILASLASWIIFVSIISACSGKDAERSRIVEEPAVYSALINEQLKDPFSYLSGDPVLIVNTTYYEEVDDKSLYGRVPSLSKDTLEDFHAVNKESQTLNLSLSISKPYEYINLPNDNNGWVELKQKYPNSISITTLSKIGFNKKLDQALVFMTYYCGTECGNANMYLLVRKGDIWMVESTINVWAS